MARKKISTKKVSGRKAEKKTPTKAGVSTAGKPVRRVVKKAVQKTVTRSAGTSAKKAGARGSTAGRRKAVSPGDASAPAVKKAAVKKAAAAKKTVSARAKVPTKAVPTKSAAATRKPKASGAVARAKKPAEGKSAKSRRMSAREMEFYRRLLLNLRDRVVDGINFLAGENLNNNTREQSGDLSNYGMHMADHGTDSFDRELALSMVSNEQELIYEIDEALERMNNGTYGICEMTGEPIERERLKVIPYARFSVKAQAEMERGRSRFRPFGASFTRSGPDVT